MDAISTVLIEWPLYMPPTPKNNMLQKEIVRRMAAKFQLKGWRQSTMMVLPSLGEATVDQLEEVQCEVSAIVHESRIEVSVKVIDQSVWYREY